MCRATVTRAVAAVPGVLNETVDLRRDAIMVQFDPKRTSPEAIADAIRRVGYHPHSA